MTIDELRELSDRRWRLMKCPGSAFMIGETEDEIDAYWPSRDDRELVLDLIVLSAKMNAQEALADEGDVAHSAALPFFAAGAGSSPDKIALPRAA